MMRILFFWMVALGSLSLEPQAQAETRPVVGQTRWVCRSYVEGTAGYFRVKIVKEHVVMEYNPFVDRNTPQWKRAPVKPGPNCSSAEDRRGQLFEVRGKEWFYVGSNVVRYRTEDPRPVAPKPQRYPLPPSGCWIEKNLTFTEEDMLYKLYFKNDIYGHRFWGHGSYKNAKGEPRLVIVRGGLDLVSPSPGRWRVWHYFPGDRHEQASLIYNIKDGKGLGQIRNIKGGLDAVSVKYFGPASGEISTTKDVAEACASYSN